jgi:signal transduction histidine kinase
MTVAQIAEPKRDQPPADVELDQVRANVRTTEIAEVPPVRVMRARPPAGYAQKWAPPAPSLRNGTETPRGAAARHVRREAAEELISVAAHDIRNLLTPLKSHLALLRSSAQRDVRAADLQEIQAANAGVERIARLVDNLLDVARLDGGAYAVDPRAVDLVALVHEAAEALATPGHALEIQAPTDLAAQVDAERLRQILDNLLSNAVKHSPKGAAVKLALVRETRADGDWAVIRVADRGPGVAPEVLPRLFGRFAAGPGSTGFGLGLYIAGRLAAAHGGALTVEPAAGPGASFTLALPLDGPSGADAKSVS